MQKDTFIATDYEHKGMKTLSAGDTVGVVFGTFAPLHKGHMRLINQSRKENAVTLVVTGGYEQDRGFTRGMSIKDRYKRLRVEFEDYDDVYVAMIDEKEEKPFNDAPSLKDFHDTTDKVLQTYITNDRSSYQVYNYVGQQDYANWLAESPIYADQHIVYVERDDETEPTCGLSASTICEHPFDYWDDIAGSFKCFFRKCVILLGAESTGKSTFAERLAKHFGGTYTEEYGRIWTSGWRHSIEADLNEYDYLAFIAGQLDINETALYEKSNSKIVFLDTDGFVTKNYLEIDTEDMDDDVRAALIKLADLSCRWSIEHADAFIVLPNDAPFVLDGSRDGHVEHIRDEYLRQLTLMLNSNDEVNNDKCYFINEGTFDDKFLECCDIIENLLQK